MKKVFILALAAVGATAMTSCGQGNAKLTTDSDTLAYALGVDMGTAAFSFDSTLNPDVLAAGMKDAFTKKGKMTREEAVAFIQEYMSVGIPRKNEEQGKKFIEEAVKSGAQSLPSGLAYKIETPGSDRKVVVGDSVYVHYTLSLPNGRELFSTNGSGEQQFLLAPGNLIPAWTEGVPLIGEGGKITLFVPSIMAYGPNGSGNGQIGPNQALKFDIEVVKVVPAVDTTATK